MQGFGRNSITRRLADMPVLAARPDEIDAGLYNLWRRLRLRTGPHVEFPLPGKPGMRIVLEDAAWCILDGSRHDVPVLAWVEFSALRSRSSLHEPIRCTLNFYHYMASSLRAPALAHLGHVLKERLRRR
jgi:hypothetical protein